MSENTNEARRTRYLDSGQLGVIATDLSQETAEAENNEEAAYWKKIDSFLVTLEDIEEEEVEWLIPGWIPKGAITTLCADGGTGKTTLWANLLADLSNGKPTILEQFGLSGLFDGWEQDQRVPQKCMFVVAEDSVAKVLKRRLRAAGANMLNVQLIHVPEKDHEYAEKFKFVTEELRRLIKESEAAVCVFDPLQCFIPDGKDMSKRNHMRSCLSPFVALGEETGCAFVIVMHTNKKTEVGARGRMADSADMWDISRSVIMMGQADSAGKGYISNEKNSYAPLAKTVLFSRDGDRLIYEGTSEWRDADFAKAKKTRNNEDQVQSKLETCKNRVIQRLQGSEENTASSEEITNYLTGCGVSKYTRETALAQLKSNGQIEYTKKKLDGEKKARTYIKLLTELSKLPDDEPVPLSFLEE